MDSPAGEAVTRIAGSERRRLGALHSRRDEAGTSRRALGRSVVRLTKGVIPVEARSSPGSEKRTFFLALVGVCGSGPSGRKGTDDEESVAASLALTGLDPARLLLARRLRWVESGICVFVIVSRACEDGGFGDVVSGTVSKDDYQV